MTESELRLEYLNNKLKLSTRERIEKETLEQALPTTKKTQQLSKGYDGIEAFFEIVDISTNKIYNAAKRTGAKAVQPELKEELHQCGMVALMEAWNNYDSAKEASFKTYAYYRVRGAMLDFLRGQDTVSRSTRAALKLITHNADNNTFSSDTLTREQINTAVKRSTIVQQFSAMKYPDGKEGDSAQNLVLDVEDTNNRYINIEAQETINTLFKKCPLTDRERIIINNHYFDEKNLYDIGKELDITESRVSQIHKEALSKLAKYV